MARPSNLLFTALFLVAPTLLAQDSGQSLADFARKEAERKKNEKAPKIVFTDDAGTTYIGCFEDRGFFEERDMHAATYKGSEMTNASCQSFCRDKGFKYAATQNGNECYCGDSYGKYGRVAESKCDKSCPGNAPGNSKEKCGGYWGNAVYQVGGVSPGAESGGDAKSETSASASVTSRLTGKPQGDGATFSVSLSAMQNAVKAGSAVWVSFVVANVSGHKIRASSFGDDLEYEIEDGAGQKVSYAKHKDRNGRTVIATRDGTGHGLSADLERGKSVKGQIPVSQYYDLSRPGTYTIQATRKDPDSNEVRISNQITVIVTP